MSLAITGFLTPACIKVGFIGYVCLIVTPISDNNSRGEGKKKRVLQLLSREVCPCLISMFCCSLSACVGGSFNIHHLLSALSLMACREEPSQAKNE